MFTYHDSNENKRRLGEGLCRCATEHNGRVFTLKSLVVDNEITDPYSPDTPLGKSPTVPGSATEAYTPGVYLYAVADNYEMRIALDCDRLQEIAVKHETLFHNADVLAAGEIAFENGMVTKLDDSSGSYGTRGALDADPKFVKALLTAIEIGAIPATNELIRTLADRLESAE